MANLATTPTCKKIIKTVMRTIGTLTLASIVPVQMALAQTAMLEQVRVADHDEFQRVVIDTNQAVTFTLIEGDEPMTIRLKGITAKQLARNWHDMGALKSLSVEPISETTADLVLTLTEPTRPRIFLYEPDSYGGHRVVIDLWPANKIARRSRAPSDKIKLTANAAPHTPVTQDTLQEPSKEPEPEELTQTNQWPSVLKETATTLTNQGTSTFFDDDEIGASATTPAAPAPITPPHETAPTPNLSETPDGTGPLALARENLAQGDPGEACRVLQVNFPQGTQNTDAMILEGDCLRALGQLSKANMLYTEVLAIDPSNVTARLGLAHVQVEQSDFSAARDNYTRVIAKLPAGTLYNETGQRLKMVKDQLRYGVN